MIHLCLAELLCEPRENRGYICSRPAHTMVIRTRRREGDDIAAQHDRNASLGRRLYRHAEQWQGPGPSAPPQQQRPQQSGPRKGKRLKRRQSGPAVPKAHRPLMPGPPPAALAFPEPCTSWAIDAAQLCFGSGCLSHTRAARGLQGGGCRTIICRRWSLTVIILGYFPLVCEVGVCDSGFHHYRPIDDTWSLSESP